MSEDTFDQPTIASPARRRTRRLVRWGKRLRQRRLPGLPSWLEALIAALVATLIGLVVLAATGVFWLWGASYTLQGIDRSLAWIATTRNLPGVLTWWRGLGDYQWAVPAAFSCSEMIWAPIRRFLPKAQGPVLVIAAIFSAVDIFTTHLGLAIRQPWRLISAIALTFLPESAGLWALQFIAEGWMNVWATLQHPVEA
ncbi:hypothetical protein K2Z83_26890 [Oscillochloris sp. ZM17-4]|uniref:hypothetical protein n=1 Tax=Oscillochloris sp. ZM17-4 TaxID=2866714 RepID=UPI001C73C3E6|nr:hypothetical protein [Oscillochloris sp. ZM17-4]MBX0331281.1 hypothetical protein [Oscillochloris sp. ZM17-4]